MDARVAATIGFMGESLMDHLSIWTLSKRVNLSPTRLRQLFKKNTGQSPMQYLRNLRMQRAEHLLRSTFLSIKEVSFFVGAKHVSHFVRDFKKKCGSTPSQSVSCPESILTKK